MLSPRYNPFRSSCIDALSYLGAEWPEIIRRLRALHWRAEIVGPHGSGKSTFIRSLGDELERRGIAVRRLSVNQSRTPREVLIPTFFAQVQPTEVVLLDGADQLSRWQWTLLRWRLQRIRGLVITAHLPGRLPLLWQCATTPGALKVLVGRLLSSEEQASITPDEIAEAFLAACGNLRTALRILYDRAGNWPEPVSASPRYP